MSRSSEATGAGAIIRDAIDARHLPWTRPLAAALTHDFPSVAPWFAGNPQDPAAWAAAIQRVQGAPRQSALTGRALSRQLDRRGAPRAAQTAAASLADAGTVAIVTGQQAGAFGGPLYTILKAVTAIQLARRVSADHGVPVGPVFWVDGEDHDWDEVCTARVLDRDFAPADVTIGATGPAHGPVAGRRLDESVGQAIDRLGEILAPTEFTADLLSRLRRHYQPGAGVATAFAGWLDDLLGDLGLVVYEAADAETKPAVARLFAQEVDAPCASRLARESADALRAHGHAPQIEPADDAVALFYLNDRGRLPIRRGGDHEYLVGDEPRSASDLQAEASSHPERFSPNVLLRPLVQDTLFPTICYVAGPAELAYQAQLGAVYRTFGVQPPLLYPRVSATLLDSAAARFLDRHALSIEALQTQDDSVLNKLLEAQLPAAVETAIRGAEEYLTGQAGSIKPAVAAIDPTLGGAVDTTIERVRETFAQLRNKVVQASKRKDETLRRQFDRARTLAFPGGKLQERALNVAFFVNRYGPTLAARLADVLPLETGKHYVVTL